MPLRKLDLHNTRVADLAPLAKCRELKNLRISSTPVRNLAPLAGLPLEALIAGGSNVTDISVLSGMPLRHVHLDHTPVTDLRPLLSCPTLRWLTVPTNAKDVGQLRSLKGLVRLSERYDLNVESPYARGGPAQTAEEFWKEFEARQAQGRK
jgi:internalin A